MVSRRELMQLGVGVTAVGTVKGGSAVPHPRSRLQTQNDDCRTIAGTDDDDLVKLCREQLTLDRKDIIYVDTAGSILFFSSFVNEDDFVRDLAEVPAGTPFKVHAIDTEKRSILWESKVTGVPISQEVQTNFLILTKDKILYAFDVESGELEWKRENYQDSRLRLKEDTLIEKGNNRLININNGNVWQSYDDLVVMEEGENIVVHNDGVIKAVNPSNNSREWTHFANVANDHYGESPFITYKLNWPLFGYVEDDDEGVTIINGETGESTSYAVPTSGYGFEFIVGSDYVAIDYIIVEEGWEPPNTEGPTGVIVPSKGTGRVVAARNGNVKWQKEREDGDGEPERDPMYIADGNIYFRYRGGSSGVPIEAIAIEDESTIWEKEVGDSGEAIWKVGEYSDDVLLQQYDKFYRVNPADGTVVKQYSGEVEATGEKYILSRTSDSTVNAYSDSQEDLEFDAPETVTYHQGGNARAVLAGDAIYLFDLDTGETLLNPEGPKLDSIDDSEYQPGTYLVETEQPATIIWDEGDNQGSSYLTSGEQDELEFESVAKVVEIESESATARVRSQSDIAKSNGYRFHPSFSWSPNVTEEPHIYISNPDGDVVRKFNFDPVDHAFSRIPNLGSANSTVELGYQLPTDQPTLLYNKLAQGEVAIEFLEIQIVDRTPETPSPTPTQTPTETETELASTDRERSEDQPGFGFISSIFGLGALLYYAKRKKTEE